MVHQVLSNTREVNEGWNAKLLQLIPGTDSRPVQDVWAAISTTADDDLLASVDLDDGAIRPDTLNPRGPQVALVVLLNDDFVDMRFDNQMKVLPGVLLGHEVGSRAAQALVDCSWSMAAAVRVVPMAEHVWVQGQPLGLHGLEDEVRDGREVVRFGVEVAIVAVRVFGRGEPWLSVEVLSLW